MTTSTISWLENDFDNFTSTTVVSSYLTHYEKPGLAVSIFLFCFHLLLRVICLVLACLCPWANYKLIQFFRTHPFHKESSAKWYIIFKAVLDTIYIINSIPVMLRLTFGIYIIDHNFLTCKFMSYVHYISDNLISIMLTFVCLDRLIRITFGYHLRESFSLKICIGSVCFFLIINIHHIIRLQYEDGFCYKINFSIWDYDFDIYYILIYPSVTMGIMLIASIIIIVSIYCNRTRRMQLKKQVPEQNVSNTFLKSDNSMGMDNDRVELVHSTDDLDDLTATVTIEENNFDNSSSEQEQRDTIDLQLSVCVVIISAIFLACNLPYFIIFVKRFFSNWYLSSFAYRFIYLILLPSIAHTISYFVFNHLAARLFPNNSA